MKKINCLLIVILFAACSKRSSHAPNIQKMELAKEGIKEKEEFPGKFQMMKWFFTGFPETYAGWKIDFKETFRITGYTEGDISYEVSIKCDTCGLLPKYTYNIYLSYGFGDEDKLSVYQNCDTTEKYFKLLYLEKDGYTCDGCDSATPHLAKEDTALEGWSFGDYKICNSDVPVGFGPNILDGYALKEITQINPPVIWDSSKNAAWVRCNIKSPESFAKRFSRRLNTAYPTAIYPTSAEEIKAIRIRKCGQ